jgi:hypothetical protein
MILDTSHIVTKAGYGRHRDQHDEEFIRKALTLVKDIGLKGASEKLGIDKGTMSKWKFRNKDL